MESTNASRSHCQRILAEVLNAATHGTGTLLAILGLILLVIKAHAQSDLTQLVAYLIYACCMIAMFLSSTLYHSLTFTKWRPLFKKIDHASIYLMIAGSYTPFLMVGLGSRFGYICLAIIWILALLGLIFEIGWTGRFPRLSTALYLLMGWLSISLIYPLIQAVSRPALFYLAGGGLVYSIGTYFYSKKHNQWMHVIWHLFVMGGAALMFWSIYRYL